MAHGMFTVTEFFSRKWCLLIRQSIISFPFCNGNRLRLKEIRLGDLFTSNRTTIFSNDDYVHARAILRLPCPIQVLVLFSVINGCHSNALAYFPL